MCDISKYFALAAGLGAQGPQPWETPGARLSPAAICVLHSGENQLQLCYLDISRAYPEAERKSWLGRQGEGGGGESTRQQDFVPEGTESSHSHNRL